MKREKNYHFGEQKPNVFLSSNHLKLNFNRKTLLVFFGGKCFSLFSLVFFIVFELGCETNFSPITFIPAFPPLCANHENSIVTNINNVFNGNTNTCKYRRGFKLPGGGR